EMVQELGRLNPTQFIWYDLYELGDYFIVVPPDKEFGFTGDSASKMIIEGDIVELAPREPIPKLGPYHLYLREALEVTKNIDIQIQ
ncbi:MAG: hypothetical protein QW438_03540, partial [Ignisphaera sp.]